MMKAKTLEFVWRASKVGGEPTDVLSMWLVYLTVYYFFSLSLSVFLIHTLTRSPSVHIMPWSYTCPPEFLFEGNNRGVLSDQSVESVALKLVSEAKGRAAYTIHGSHVMWLWGMHIYRRDICSSSLTAFSLSPTRSRLSL